MHVLVHRILRQVCVPFQPQSSILILSKLDSLPAHTKKKKKQSDLREAAVLIYCATFPQDWPFDDIPSRLAVTSVVKSDNKEGDI